VFAGVYLVIKYCTN